MSLRIAYRRVLWTLRSQAWQRLELTVYSGGLGSSQPYTLNPEPETLKHAP
jgi:hypothetical protein